MEFTITIAIKSPFDESLKTHLFICDSEDTARQAAQSKLDATNLYFQSVGMPVTGRLVSVEPYNRERDGEMSVDHRDPKWVTAKLIKYHFSSGFEAVKPDVPLGTEYRVDLNSRHQTMDLGMTMWAGVFPLEIIMVDNGMAFPTELLEIPVESNEQHNS